MSANRNTESMAAKHEEFRSRVPPSEPLTTKGHKPGVLVGNEAVPEYHAEAFPPGTAPREHTFQPRPEEFAGQGSQAYPETTVDPLDSLPGSTSQQVHTGLGKPIQGQENRELHKDHTRKREKEGLGLAGVGASVGVDMARQKGADLPEGVHKGMRGKASADYPSATERVPESAETVASETTGPSGRVYDYSETRRQ